MLRASDWQRYKDRLTPMRYHPKQEKLFLDTKTIRYRYNVVHPGRRCLAKGTLIHLYDGSVKNIEDVVPGDIVWSLNHEGKLEPKRVISVFDNGIQECVGMETSSGKYIQCTEEHRFFRNKKWVKTMNLFRGEFIATFNDKNLDKESISFFCGVGLKKTYDLTVEDNHCYVANGFITHNSGKTEIVGKRRLVARAVMGVKCHNPRYFVAAPTRDQVKKIYWRDLKTMTLPYQDPNKEPRESELIIYLRGDREIHLLGMDKPERIEGSHWDGGVLDEYANMKKETWEEHVQPALNTEGRPPGWCDFVGVPEGRNHYYRLKNFAAAQMIEHGDDSEWAVWHWKSAEILSEKRIQRAKEQMDELTFAQEYCHLPETEIRLWNGSVKQIKDIVPGDIIPSYQNGVVVPTNVVRSFSTGKKEILEVLLENGEVFQASCQHKMKIDGKKVSLEDCTHIEVVKTIFMNLSREEMITGYDGRKLKLKIISKKPVGIKEVRNITVDNPDHSYILANGFNNYNCGDFINFKGRAYYNFFDTTHCAKLHYNPKKNLILCFDFNVDPGIAVVIQEQNYVDPKTMVPIVGTECTGVIGEVWIPRNSNTEKVSKKLVEDWGDHQGEVYIFGDASGGARGSAQVKGSDWDLVKQVLEPVFGDRLHFRVPLKNPPIRSRVNSVNSRLTNTMGDIRLQVDPTRAPHVVTDFEGVALLEGGAGEIDKKADEELTHCCFGKGTLVDTDKGTIPIETLPKFGKIKTYDGTYVYFKNPGSRGFKNTVNLVLNTGDEIVCTEDHLFLTENGWVEACCLLDTMLCNTQLINFKKATIIAKQLGLERNKGKQCRLELAKFVEKSSEKIHRMFIKRKSSDFVQDNAIIKVEKIIDNGVQEVFCPTVETGCFTLFDQLVVSNSDALGYYVVKKFPVIRRGDQVRKVMGF